MNFRDCMESRTSILMEGALGERLKREYHIEFDEQVAMGGLVYSEEGRKALTELWTQYAETAKAFRLPFMATTPTRRVNKERVEKSGFDTCIIRDNVSFLRSIQKQSGTEMYVGGLLGCRGNAYTGEGALDMEAAKAFHGWEVDFFAQSGVDFLYAGIIPSVSEAAGIALAIQATEIPYIISFTIQKNGCLIDGTPISEAIQYIDNLTGVPPQCYMTNCVHPSIAYQALSQPFNLNQTVRRRFLGIQANTSPLPYAELDNSIELKSSDPIELASEMVRLREICPIKIFGGCCGTDQKHMNEIAKRI